MPQQLAACKTVQDMYGVYAEFFQTAYADYQAEFEQMSKLGKSLAEDTVQAVQSGAEEVVRAPPRRSAPRPPRRHRLRRSGGCRRAQRCCARASRGASCD